MPHEQQLRPEDAPPLIRNTPEFQRKLAERNKLVQKKKGVFAQNRLDTLFQDLLKRQQVQGQNLSSQFQVGLGQQLGTAQRRFEQQAGRRGLTGSGVEQAGFQALSGQASQNIAAFQTKLAIAQQQEQAAFKRGEFEFFNQIALLHERGEIERHLLRFQAQLAADQQSNNLFGQILQTGATIALAI